MTVVSKYIVLLSYK